MESVGIAVRVARSQTELQFGVSEEYTVHQKYTVRRGGQTSVSLIDSNMSIPYAHVF